MSTLTIPNTIQDGQKITASPHAENYSAIAAYVNQNCITKDGALAMDNALILSDGQAAVSQAAIDSSLDKVMRIGDCGFTFSETPPENCLFLRGQAVSRSTYAELFALWGEKFGSGNGTTTFNVPNTSGRSLFGFDTTVAPFNTVGKTGGSKDAVVVQHNHSMDHSHSNNFSIENATVTVDIGHTHSSATLPNHRHSVDPPNTSVSGGRGVVGNPSGWPTDGIGILYGPAGEYRFANNEVAGVSRSPTNWANQALSVNVASFNSGNPTSNPSISIPSYAGNKQASPHKHTLSGSVSSHSGNTGNQGESGTDKNLPPYITVNFYVRAK